MNTTTTERVNKMINTLMDKMGYTDKFHYTHAKSLILLIQHNTQGTQNRSQPKVPGQNKIDKNRH